MSSSQKGLSAIARISPELIWAVNSSGIVTFISHASRSIYGREPSEIIGRPFLDFVPPEQAELDRAAFARSLAEGCDTIAYTARIARADGTTVTLITDVTVVRDDAGHVQEVVGISRELSEDEHYKLLFTGNPLPMWIYDTTTLRFLSVNEAAIEQYGYSESEFLSMTIADLHLPEDVEWLKRTVARVVGRTKYFGTWRHRRKDGVLFDAEISGNDVAFDDKPARLVVVRDVTERRRAEERIAEQAALLDKANDVIIVRDLNHAIRYWNRSAERVFGWSAAEAQRVSGRDLLPVDPTDYDRALAVVLEQSEWKGRIQKRTKSGGLVTMQAQWTLLRDDAGHPLSVLSIENDVTEQLRLESIAVRTQRLESLGTLAGGIAHDLNNVFTPILMALELLKDETTEDGHALLNTLALSAKRGADLVKQVLWFARGMEGARVSVDVASVVDDVVTVLRETFPKHIRIEIERSGKPWAISGDPTQIHQVLLNLCVNGRDAMPDGGLLTIELSNVTLDDTYTGLTNIALPGPYVAIAVTDTGEGIPPAIRDRIFEPFFTTKPVGSGTGLGLSTSQGIIKGHGGFINVYTEVGHGTTFKIYLPAGNQVAATIPLHHDEHLPRGNGELLLLVDDETAVRDVVARTLQRFNYRVLVAANGAEAIAMYAERRNEVALVITDMAMPVMDGPALIIALRTVNPEVKIIGSSGLASNNGVARALSAGVEHFVPKPYMADALLTMIERVLHSRA